MIVWASAGLWAVIAYNHHIDGADRSHNLLMHKTVRLQNLRALAGNGAQAAGKRQRATANRAKTS